MPTPYQNLEPRTRVIVAFGRHIVIMDVGDPHTGETLNVVIGGGLTRAEAIGNSWKFTAALTRSIGRLLPWEIS